jgi:hypothetical protein
MKIHWSTQNKTGDTSGETTASSFGNNSSEGLITNHFMGIQGEYLINNFYMYLSKKKRVPQGMAIFIDKV